MATSECKVLKVFYGSDIFRLRLPADTSFWSYEGIGAIVRRSLPSAQGRPHITYVDEEGDHCVLCETTFEDFLNSTSSNVIKVYITMVPSCDLESPHQCRGRSDHRRGCHGNRCHGNQNHGDRCHGNHNHRRRHRCRSRSSSHSSSSSSGNTSSSGSSSGSSTRSSSSCSSRRSRSRSRSVDRHSVPSWKVSDGVFEDDQPVLTITMPETYNRRAISLMVPGGSAAVRRAFYGDPNRAWDRWDLSAGRDVTEDIRVMLDHGVPVRAQNRLFGDPAVTIPKVLLVKATISKKPPVAPEMAAGFLESLREEYCQHVRCGVGLYFDKAEASHSDRCVLDPFEVLVRHAEDPNFMIAQIARTWSLA